MNSKINLNFASTDERARKMLYPTGIHKRILCVFFFSLSFWCLSAQTAFELIAADPRLAFGNMYPYQPMDTTVSQAPGGFEPFYISHFGRHGSRYDTEETSKYHILETLKKYHDTGLFTEKGEQLYRDVLYVREQTDGKNGMLTRRGALEQRQIAERMCRHYRSVFSGAKKIETYTTMVPRVVESRDNFIGVLSAKVPDIKIELNYSRDDARNLQEVCGRNMTRDEMAVLNNDGTVAAVRERKWAEWTPDQFPEEIFKESSRAGNVKMFMYQIVAVTKCVYCMDGDMPDIASYFSAYELCNLWWRSNLVWFARHGISEDNRGIRSDIKGRLITEAIIDDVQSAIKNPGKTAATLRFGHDGDLHPLLCFLDIEGANAGSAEEVGEKARDFELVRTGSNLQLVFYRNAKGVILVKPMLNEKECAIADLKPFEGHYYLWKDVRKFWENRSF